MNFLVDPTDVTKFDRTEPELELFWMFCCVVAGKKATTQAKLLNNFIHSLNHPPLGKPDSPFQRIRSTGYHSQIYYDLLESSKLGQYNRLSKCFRESVQVLDGSLKTCTIQELESITGVGPKTARFFVLHSRPNSRIAVLDTHVLKYLRTQGIDAPKGTPPKGEKYSLYEEEFIKLAEASGMSIADFDLKIWREFSGN